MKLVLVFVLVLAALAPLAVSQVYINPVDRGIYIPPPLYGYGVGGYYPGVYGIGGDRIGRDIGAASLGAAIGAAASRGSPKWTAVGALAGLGAAELGGYIEGRRNRSLDCGKRKLSRKDQQSCAAVVAEQEARAREAQAHAAQQVEIENRRARGGYLRNATSYPVGVTDCDQQVAVLRPGQRVFALEARCGYKGTLFVPSADTVGVRDERQAAFIISDDGGGWVFHTPPLQGGGR